MMKHYESPRAELSVFPRNDVLTSSSLADRYIQNGEKVDRVDWESLI